MEYTVVATSYNDRDNIENYISDIVNQSFKPSRIIVVDGGSTDGTEIMAERLLGLNGINYLVISGRRLTIAQGYNEAIRNSKTEYIGITGIGNRYDKDFFYELSKDLPIDGDASYPLLRGENRNHFSEVYNITFLNGESGLRSSFPSNHGCLIKKSIFEDLGYFHEGFVHAGEDSEFYELLIGRNYELSISEGAVVRWETPLSFKEFCKQLRSYTIGDMQRLSQKRFFSRYRYCVLGLLVTISIILFGMYNAFNGATVISMTCFASVLLELIFLKLKAGRRSLILITIKRVMPLIYAFGNIRFLGKEYNINR